MRTRPALVAVLVVAAACAGCAESSKKAVSNASPSPSGSHAKGGAAQTKGRYGSAVAAAPRLAPGSQANAYSTSDAELRPPIDAAQDASSTFAMDVDTASYTLARALIRGGTVPDASLVRAEEFVNAFDMHYPDPSDAFGITVDGGPALVETAKLTLRIGIQARRPAERDTRKPAVLTFVLDVSGSMQEPNKLDLVKESMGRLVDALRPDDAVQIVVYSDQSRVVLPATNVAQKSAIHDAIDALHSEGSTNAEAGLTLGYQAARQAFVPGATNRVILATDGLANQGDTSAEGLLSKIKHDAGDGIQIVVLGFGYQANNDALMEKVADNGNGFYAFVDGPGEAHRLFEQNLTTTLEPAALDAKVQVTFDPAVVKKYRLVGYDDRALADKDFRDDTVDGGEVNVGHSVTALYSLELTSAAADGNLGTVHIRWKDPESKAVRELNRSVTRQDLFAHDNFSPRLRLATVAGAFAEALRVRSRSQLETVAHEADLALVQLPGDADAQELASLVHDARRLLPR